MDNKERFLVFVQAAALILWGMIAICTSATVWNSKPCVFLSVIAALNLVANGVGIFLTAKRLKW